MSYTNNVPQANQTIAFTQPLIQANFTYIDTAMKVDHAWNGNEINSQADGTHQKISLPNQPTDITGALPTGISSIIYAIGGNIFAWNGGKRPISGVAVSGTVNLTLAGNSIATLPNECHGFVTVWAGNNLVNLAASYAFFMVGGVGYFQQSVQPVGSQTTIVISITGNTLNIARASGTDILNAPYKIIYWPV